MPWSDGQLTCLPVRLDDALRDGIERHRNYLVARQKYTGEHKRISLAEAARDLLSRALGRKEVRVLRLARTKTRKARQIGLFDHDHTASLDHKRPG